MWTGLSFLLQTQKCKFVIGNIHTNVSVHQHSGDLLVQPDGLWDAVLCVKVVLKWKLGKKCCKVSWFITVTHWRICTVMFVLFTDSVNNRVVPTVDKSHE